MTREEIIQFLYEAFYVTPFYDWDDAEKLCQKWIANASPQELDLLLEIAADPSDAHENATQEDIDAFDFAFDHVLLLWMEQNPLGFIEKTGPLLANSKARTEILSAMGCIKRQEALPYLEPLVNHLSGLSLNELCSLIYALGSIDSQTARDLLKQIQATRPMNNSSINEALSSYLS